MRGKVNETQNTSTNTNSTPNPLSVSFKPSKPKSKSKSKSKSTSTPLTNPDVKCIFDSPPFIHPEFTHRHQWHLLTTTVFSLSSSSATSTTPWLYATVDGGVKPPQLLHPLTLKPHHSISPINLHLSRALTSFKHTDFPFDKIVITTSKHTDPDRNTMVVLFGGGHLVARLPWNSTEVPVKWVTLSEDKIDDIILSGGLCYVVNRLGKLYAINRYVYVHLFKMWPYAMTLPVTLGLTQVGFRKRLVFGFRGIHLVVRLNVEIFRVWKMCKDDTSDYWDEIKGFDGEKVLFVSKDCCFFTKGFGGREYENCIVFTEAGFPRYGDDGWEYNAEDGIWVFRMSDGRYGKVGESIDFPEIDWSAPSWVFDVRELDEDGGMREQEERPDADIRDVEGEKLQCSSNSREHVDEEMQSNANIEGDASLQDNVPTSLFASMSAIEEEVTRTLLLMNGGNEPTDKETSRENNTPSAPRACTSSSTSTKRYKSDFATTKFEGFDIRSDLVPTLQKIWRNHGNITENCPIRSTGLMANVLESLATVVQILENNSAESLNESQADYLSTTLSDLRFMCFNVDWLSSFVEKAVKLHKSKALVDSLNKLEQLSSQVKESRDIFLEKAAKLTEEENKLEKEMARVSKLIPLSGEVKFDEPFGSGLS